MPAVADEAETTMAKKDAKPNRTGRPFALYIAPDVDAGLEAFRQGSELSPPMNAAINHLLREVLKERGYIPKPKGQGPRRQPEQS